MTTAMAAAAAAQQPPTLLKELSLGGLAETVLPFRSAAYISGLCEKLLGEGVAGPTDLLGASKEALETKLSTHAAFNFIEMADAISLRSAVERAARCASFAGSGAGSGATRRRASRGGQRRRVADAAIATSAGSAHGRSSSAGADDMSTGEGPSAAGRAPTSCRRRRSRSPARGRRPPQRGGQRGGGRANASAASPSPDCKPELWAAVERGDGACVRILLGDGRDMDERYQGWTPLMKAAEEDRLPLMEELLSRRADLEAANRRGRTALSFAAAPSRGRAAALGALRLMLERGADFSRKDADGLTARQRATREHRQDAVEVFDEFERSLAAANAGADGAGSGSGGDPIGADD